MRSYTALLFPTLLSCCLAACATAETPFFEDGVDGGAPDFDAGEPGFTSALCYEEELTPDASFSDIAANYGGISYKDHIIAAVKRVWPAGDQLLEYTRDDPNFDSIIDVYSWTDAAEPITSLVHELTHGFNRKHAELRGVGHLLFFNNGEQLELPSDANSFPRAEIFDHLAPFAAQDHYAELYLQDDAGQRGFNALLDEGNSYAASLPVIPIFESAYLGFGRSIRDGSVAFLYFTQVYLRVARTEYPAYYAEMRSNQAVLEAVALSWLRVMRYWEYVGEYERSGILDDLYMEEILKPENLAELEMLTGLQFGTGHCATPVE